MTNDLVLLLVTASLAAAAVAVYWNRKDDGADLYSASRTNVADDSFFSLPRNRNFQNVLTNWNDAWELRVDRGRVTFRVSEAGNKGTGLIIALANEWKSASAGGVAVVLRDGLPAPFEKSEYAVVARNRSYFATMPYFNRPAFESSTSLNHEIREDSEYVLEWSPLEIVFGRVGENPILSFDRTATTNSASFRYLAFGTFGAERLNDHCDDGDSRCAVIGDVKLS